jgi:hypothetical protein
MVEVFRDHIAFVEDLTGRNLDAWRDVDMLIERHAGA